LDFQRNNNLEVLFISAKPQRIKKIPQETISSWKDLNRSTQGLPEISLEEAKT